MATFILAPPPQLLLTCSHKIWANLLFYSVRRSTLCPGRTANRSSLLHMKLLNPQKKSLTSILSTPQLNESQSHLVFITPWHIRCCSVGSFSDHDFLNWLCCLVMWFYLNLEEISCCSMNNSPEKDSLGREDIKSVSESSTAFPHFEFP